MVTGRRVCFTCGSNLGGPVDWDLDQWQECGAGSEGGRDQAPGVSGSRVEGDTGPKLRCSASVSLESRSGSGSCGTNLPRVLVLISSSLLLKSSEPAGGSPKNRSSLSDPRVDWWDSGHMMWTPRCLPLLVLLAATLQFPPTRSRPTAEDADPEPGLDPDPDQDQEPDSDTDADSVDSLEEDESSSEETRLAPESTTGAQNPQHLAPHWSAPGKMARRVHGVWVGRTAKFRCPAAGNPTPSLHWYKNGKELEEQRPAGLEVPDQVWTLTIEAVVPSDGGNYSCVAENQHGSLRRDFLLDVFEGSALRPILRTGPHPNRTVLVGSDVDLECWVYSDPPHHVKWVRHIGSDGLPHALVSKAADLERDVEVLALKNVSVLDSGRYTCLAENSVGESHQSLWLTVVPGPSPMPLLTQSYLEVFLYCLGFFIVIILAVMAAACRLCCAPQKTGFSSSLAVQKLSKTAPLKKQVRSSETFGPPEALTPVPPQDSASSTQSASCLVPKSRLSSTTSGSDQPYDPLWEVPRDRLSLGHPLGEGCFGRVVLGQVAGLDQNISRISPVAVKMLKAGASERDQLDLIAEMEMMKTIGRHQNIINLVGACTHDGPLYVLVEFASQGNLRDYLRARRPAGQEYWGGTGRLDPASLELRDLVSAAFQVSRGMCYLASKKCIHRDLAARNVLVTDDFVMKIADFGLARDVHHIDYYKKTTNGRLPVKWMAPEALFDRVYTPQSDVWSFGVLLWEVFTLGGSPYPGIPVEGLFKLLKEGHRMERPAGCPPELYQLMRSCWTAAPAGRPTFQNLVEELDRALLMASNQEYLDLAVSPVQKSTVQYTLIQNPSVQYSSVRPAGVQYCPVSTCYSS
ncbi:LOW QUALITY PROTEIN: fibroblast growth factor receptor 1b [Neosynchiropus ocellatus]